MKIQRRLTLGIGILFAMIVLLGIQSVSYTHLTLPTIYSV